VRWIETQDVIFDASMNVERLIEIGPSPTLAGMAQRTLKTKYEGYDQALGMQRQVLAYSKEGKEIYYNVDPPVVEEAAPVESAPAPTAATSAPAAPVAAPAAAPSGPVAQIPDEPVKAVDIVHTVAAQKLKKTLEEVSPGKAIKDLVGGKSTLQVYLIISCFANGRTKYLVIYRKSSVDYPSTPLKMSPLTNWVQRFNLPSEERSANSLQG
jgi:fatty acid synthase subunit alpha, fungi type